MLAKNSVKGKYYLNIKKFFFLFFHFMGFVPRFGS